MHASRSFTRCSAVWLGVTIPICPLLVWLLRDIAALDGGRLGFADLLLGVAELVLAGCAAWFWLVTTVVAAHGLRGDARESRPRPLGCPAGLRRALFAACGLALTSQIVAPALAADPHHQSVPASLVVGLPLPDRALSTSPPPQERSATPVRRIAVQPGDTLWAITASLLPPGADDARIAAGWHALHQANRALIGPDPDLILPGTRLAIPTFEEAPR
ncbi:LysM peptidoglycan-binding domain-containing protein [Nocardioides sp.]|uniref:LysM peptidoglycan-binding domain-containing protein n=1 Tax=Nocardioides sp. TaxID=35761 RepID=UPI003D148BE3